MDWWNLKAPMLVLRLSPPRLDKSLAVTSLSSFNRVAPNGSMKDIPDDTLSIVFDCMHIPDVCRAARVSSRFVWVVDRMLGRLESVKFGDQKQSNLNLPRRRFLQSVWRRCPNLKEINFGSVHRLKDINKTLLHCRKLELIFVKSVKHKQVIELPTLFQRFANIKLVCCTGVQIDYNHEGIVSTVAEHLHEIKSLASVFYVDLESNSLASLAERCLELEYLALKADYFHKRSSELHSLASVQPLVLQKLVRNLSHLRLQSFCGDSIFDALSGIGWPLEHLKTLELSSCHVKDHVCGLLPQLTPNLAELNLRNNRELGDEGIAEMAFKLDLRILNLHDTSITLQTIDLLNEFAFPNLTDLMIHVKFRHRLKTVMNFYDELIVMPGYGEPFRD